MSKTIHKYQITGKGHDGILLPAGADILSVAEQHGEVLIWMLLDPDCPKEVRKFSILGTGWKLTDEIDTEKFLFLNTVHMKNGDVWHVFEKLED